MADSYFDDDLFSGYIKPEYPLYHTTYIPNQGTMGLFRALLGLLRPGPDAIPTEQIAEAVYGLGFVKVAAHSLILRNPQAPNQYAPPPEVFFAARNGAVKADDLARGLPGLLLPSLLPYPESMSLADMLARLDALEAGLAARRKKAADYEYVSSLLRPAEIKAWADAVAQAAHAVVKFESEPAAMDKYTLASLRGARAAMMEGFAEAVLGATDEVMDFARGRAAACFDVALMTRLGLRDCKLVMVPADDPAGWLAAHQSKVTMLPLELVEYPRDNSPRIIHAERLAGGTGRTLRLDSRNQRGATYWLEGELEGTAVEYGYRFIIPEGWDEPADIADLAARLEAARVPTGDDIDPDYEREDDNELPVEYTLWPGLGLIYTTHLWSAVVIQRVLRALLSTPAE